MPIVYFSLFFSYFSSLFLLFFCSPVFSNLIVCLLSSSQLNFHHFLFPSISLFQVLCYLPFRFSLLFFIFIHSSLSFSFDILKIQQVLNFFLPSFAFTSFHSFVSIFFYLIFIHSFFNAIPNNFIVVLNCIFSFNAYIFLVFSRYSLFLLFIVFSIIYFASGFLFSFISILAFLPHLSLFNFLFFFFSFLPNRLALQFLHFFFHFFFYFCFISFFLNCIRHYSSSFLFFFSFIFFIILTFLYSIINYSIFHSFFFFLFLASLY